MKKLLIITIVILVFANFCQAEEIVPWDDKGTLYAGYGGSSSDMWSIWVGDRYKEYDKRFGRFPIFMLLEDKVRPIMIKWEIYFGRTKANWNVQSSWGDTLYWRDVQKYLYWRLESAKTGQVVFFPVRQGDPDELISDNIGRNGWLIEFKFDLNEINIPNDGSSYNMSIEAHIGDPNDEKGMKFEYDGELHNMEGLYIAKSTIQTTLDSFLLGRQEGKLFGKNPDKSFLLEMNRHFRYSIFVTESLCNIYFRERNADSLRWIAKDFLKANEWGNSPFFEYTEEMREARKDHVEQEPIYPQGQKRQTPIERIHEMLFKLDGDTTIFK